MTYIPILSFHHTLISAIKMQLKMKVILVGLVLIFLMILISINNKPLTLETEAQSNIESKKVLLMAYWRTGSSYFGQLLSHYPQTYYNYEPMHFLSNPVSIVSRALKNI